MPEICRSSSHAVRGCTLAQSSPQIVTPGGIGRSAAKPQPKRSATGPRSLRLRLKRDAWLNPTSHCDRGRCGRGPPARRSFRRFFAPCEQLGLLQYGARLDATRGLERSEGRAPFILLAPAMGEGLPQLGKDRGFCPFHDEAGASRLNPLPWARGEAKFH